MSVRTAVHRPGSATATPRKRQRGAKRLPLPVIGLGLMVVFSVGFGIGSIHQFDTDWRTGTPAPLEAIAGTWQPGDDIASTVTELLANTAHPVAHVVCGATETVPTGGAAALTASARTTGEQLLCRGRSSVQMVDILTQIRGEQIAVTEFAAK